VPQERHARLLSDLTSAVLHDAGFRRRGSTWALETAECWQIIQVQNSRSNSRDRIQFTINVSVASKRILRATVPGSTRSPAEMDCHLRRRLGHLIPDIGKDYWWQIDVGTNMGALREEISTALVRHALPWLSANASEAALHEIFASGRGTTKTMASRYAQLLAAETR
jgi:hypothetical protein